MWYLNTLNLKLLGRTHNTAALSTCVHTENLITEGDANPHRHKNTTL